MPDAASATRIARGQLSMRVCGSCEFVYNGAFEPDLLSYGSDYDNTQTCSSAFDAHVNQLVRRLIDDCGVRNCRVVEVGCGKGEFLRRIVEDPAANNVGIGFDQSYVGPESALGGRLRFEKRFYDETASHVAADVVICRHVIEHVPEPLQLVRSVHGALQSSPHARVFFETPCVRWILENQVVWDFFYEHCSLFSIASLKAVFERGGFKVEDAQHVFGGQYLWLEAVRASRNDWAPAGQTDIVALANAYSAAERSRVEQWTRRLEAWARIGRIALWGAGAKGVTFANIADAERTRIHCVADINPAKQGRFVPGTGHRIVAPETLGHENVRFALVLNPNYQAEIVETVRKLALDIEVVDLMNNGTVGRAS